jgi:uncharacterized protein
MRRLIKGLMAATLMTATLTTSAAFAADPVTPAPIMADPALWVVKDKDTTIYLFGTIHVLKPNIQWFDGGVKKAYDASSEIFLEVIEPDSATAQQMVMSRAIDPDGPALTKKLSPEAATAYAGALKSLGIPEQAFDPLEPWFATIAISMTSLQKTGYSPESGVEKQLTAAVKRDGKKLSELESIQFQLDLFDTMPEAQQIAFLNSTVKELPKATETLDRMLASWGKGDPDTLAKDMNEAMLETPELAKLLLADRNKKWADWIQNRLSKPGTIFIAVGAGHLAGKESVQALLKARKIVAKRIPS